mmetsp:Transcript_45094/g.54638  ORF Transcript_45094/g.54638 Transcript_45094/m.54638 type:complete len:115 (+) Transcript_45094:3-347(+)
MLPAPAHNWLAVDNLNTLNDAVSNGLWGGRVTVFEFGVEAVRYHPVAGMFPTVTAAMMDYFLAVDAVVFIGTEVSSWSADVAKTRFYLGNRENYKYVPWEIDLWTKDRAPAFVC